MFIPKKSAGDLENACHDIHQSRIAFVEGVQKGLKAFLGLKNLSADHKDFDSSHGAVHKFACLLESMKIDGPVFAGVENDQEETAPPPWKESITMTSILTLRTKLHRFMQAHYKHGLAQYLCDKHSRVCCQT